MSTHIPQRDIVCHNGRHRKARPKTFRSIELANTWAANNKVTKFEVVQLKEGLSPKYKIVSKA